MKENIFLCIFFSYTLDLQYESLSSFWEILNGKLYINCYNFENLLICMGVFSHIYLQEKNIGIIRIYTLNLKKTNHSYINMLPLLD